MNYFNSMFQFKVLSETNTTLHDLLQKTLITIIVHIGID